MVNKPVLFIPIEVKSRELYSKSLLALYAAARGFYVLLGRKSELNQLALRASPGAYYGLGTVQNMAEFYGELSRRGNVIVVNDEEGLTTFSASMYLDLRVAPDTLQAIDLLFTWGDENNRVISSGRPEFKDKLRITGNPRFDLLKSTFRGIYDSEVKKINSKFPSLVLICTSFGCCNHYISGIDYVQSLIEKKVLTTEKDIQDYLIYSKGKSKAFSAFLEAIPLLAQAFPEIQFVIRPHPSESAEPYKQFGSSYANVYLETEFPIHAWLFASKAIVHHYCTTAVEAFAAGVPGFALRPQRLPEVETEIPYGCSREVRSGYELVEALRPCLRPAAGESFSLVAPALPYSRYVRNISDDIACQLIVDQLAERLSMRGPPPQSLMVPVRPAFDAKQFVKSFVSQFLPSNWKNRGYVAHKVGGLTANEVQSILEKLNPHGDISFVSRRAGHKIVSVECESSH